MKAISIPRWMRAAAALGLLSVMAAAASAQTIPDDLKQKLIEAGPNYTSKGMLELFRPQLLAAPKDGVKVTKNVAYGDNPREVMDLYQPEGKSHMPILIYLHGGSYVGGSKDVNDVVYSNVTTYFARHGMLSINAEYRLAPAFPWPAGAQDVASMVAWAKKNAAQYGGDPDRIYLIGHSAGATHVATYAFDRRFQPHDGPGIAGVILISGRYRVYDNPDDPAYGGVRAYFGSDPARYASRSIVNHVPNSHVAAMLVTTEFDQKNLAATTGEMFKALCDRDGGQCPRLVQLKYQNHLSEMYAINTPDDFLGKEILEFIGTGPVPDWPTSK